MEIDIVINRTLVLEGRWEELYDEVKVLRKACGEAHLKTIIATGHLADMENVYKLVQGLDVLKWVQACFQFSSLFNHYLNTKFKMCSGRPW